MLSRDEDASAHWARLARSYQDVAERTWLNPDFLASDLEASTKLFTPDSLTARRPRPRALEVFALLSGLPFPAEFAGQLAGLQQRISAVLGDTLHYWVAAANLGVEYCVFKWPTDSWEPERLEIVQGVLASIRQPSFEFSIRGVQVNPDGCVVAKGFDEGAVFPRIRQHVKQGIPFLPAKQSGWAHVPLGRILQPLGAGRFPVLRRLISSLSDTLIARTTIDSLKLIHEKRWYMEEKTVLAEYPLIGESRGPQ